MKDMISESDWDDIWWKAPNNTVHVHATNAVLGPAQPNPHDTSVVALFKFQIQIIEITDRNSQIHATKVQTPLHRENAILIKV